MRSSWNMWEPIWYPDPAIGYWPERCLGHVCMFPEPVGSTHLRFGDARVVMGNSMWLPKVVRSPGCDPGRHEEFQNGPAVKIYIWEVLFWSPEKLRVLSVTYQDHREGPGGPPGGATYPGGPHGLKWEGNQPLVGWCAPHGPPPAPRVGNPRGGGRPTWLGGQATPLGRRPP